MAKIFQDKKCILLRRSFVVYIRKLHLFGAISRGLIDVCQTINRREKGYAPIGY